MNKTTLYIISGILIIILIITSVKLSNIRKDRDVQYHNFIQSDKDNKNLILTMDQLKDQYSELDSLLKKEKIKKNKVEYIINTKYIYKKDTFYIEVKDVIWNESDSTFKFNYNQDCLKFTTEGDIKNKLFKVYNIEYSENLTYIGYIKKEKTGRKFLWVFNIKKPYLELKTVSKCGETKTTYIDIQK